MESTSSILDGLMPKFMESIKADCLSKPFTAKRSIIVDQILHIEDRMNEGMSFPEAVRRLNNAH